MVADLNMSQGKMSNFVSFQMFGFTLVIKLRKKIDFENYLSTSILCHQNKNDARFEYNLSEKV